MTEEHPLRGVISCPNCNRMFTSWTTTKSRMKDGVKIKKLYPYYGCANPNCDKKVNINKQYMENAFFELLGQMHLPKKIASVVKKVFTKCWNNHLTKR